MSESRQGSRWAERLLPVLGIAGVVALWWLLVAGFDVQPYIAPSPGVVLRTLVARHAVLLGNMVPTALEAAGGFLLGNAAAFCIAALFVQHRRIRQALLPVFALLNAIPIVAKAPILLLLLGNGIEPKIAIAALVCFFPTLVNSVKGLESVNPQSMELMRVLSASRMETFLHLRLPGALPHIFSGLRVAAPASVVGAVVGEWVGADSGVGAMILQAMYNFDSPMLYAAVVASSALAGAAYLLVGLAERLLVRWQRPQ